MASLQKELAATKTAKQQALAEEMDALVAAHDTDMKALQAKHATALDKAAVALQQQQAAREQEVGMQSVASSVQAQPNLQIQTAGEQRVQELHDEIQALVDACDVDKAAKQEELATIKDEHEKQVGGAHVRQAVGG